MNNNTYQWDGWPHRVDGWIYTVKPYVKCGQAMQDDIDNKEERQKRLNRYRKLAEKGKPLL